MENMRPSIGLRVIVLAFVTGCNSGGTATPDLSAPKADLSVADLSALKPAKLQIDKMTSDFASVVLGATSPAATFTITNVGEVPSGTLASTLTNNDGVFAIQTNSCTAALGPNENCVVGVTFTPTAAGAESATLQVVGDPGGTASATLSGEGIQPGTLMVSASTNALGTVSVGATGTTISTFTVTNMGQTATGAITVQPSGSDPSEFTLSSDGCSGMTLSATDSCTFNVQLAPKSRGPKSASFEISANPVGIVTGAVSGLAVAPAQLMVADQAMLGSVGVNQTGTTVTLTVQNLGEGPTGALSVGKSGTDAAMFSASGCDGMTLSVGATCNIDVALTPTTVGSKSAQLTISGTPGGSVTTLLSGEGISASQLAIAPTAHGFASTQVGQSSSAFTFTISNNSAGPSGTIKTVFTGIGASQFQLATAANHCDGVSLAQGQSCSVDALYSPTAGGPTSALLTVASPQAGTVSAGLSGLGLASAQLAIAPAQKAFGAVLNGAHSVTQTFTITNIGGQTSGTPIAMLGGASSDQFEIVANGCTDVIPATQGCIVQVRFSPTAVASATATLDISATPGGSVSANLTSDGVAPGQILFDPSSFNFAVTAVGDSVVQTFTVRNTGAATTGTLTVTPGVSGNPGDFQVTNNCVTLDSNASCSVTVTFTPTGGGLRTATLTVSGAPGGSANLALAGTGQSRLEIVSLNDGPVIDPFDFGDLPVNSTILRDVFIRVRNNTTSDKTLSLAESYGTPAQFVTRENSCGATNMISGGGGTCLVHVTFGPTVAGVSNGSATFSIGSGAANQAVVNLTGRGGDSLSIAAFTTSGFGNVARNTTSSPLSFRVTNAIGSPTSGTLTTGALMAPFQIVGDTCNTHALAAGASCQIDVTFTPASSTAASASLSVSATPGGTPSIMITGTGVDPTGSAPTDITLTPNTIAENRPASTTVGALTSVDADSGQTYVYTLVAGAGATDNGSFAVSGSAIITTASFDFEAQPSYSIRVRSNDSGGMSFEKAITITVTNVNEAPTDIALAGGSIAENQPSGTAVGMFSATDPDAGDTQTYTLVAGTGSTDNGAFAIVGNQLSSTMSFDFETKSSYSIRVRATDAGALFFEKVFAITVTDVDDPPVAVNDVATLLEDAGASAINVLSNDTDTDGGPKTVNLVTQGSSGTVAITGGGSGVTYTPSANYCGSDSFTYTLNGGSIGTVNITVTCVNDVPSFTKGSDELLLVNQSGGLAATYSFPGWATSLSAGPANESSQPLSFNIVSDSNPGIFSIAPTVSSTGTLTFTTNSLASGSSTITITLQDSGGTANGGVDTSASQSFVISTAFPAPTATNDAYAATGNIKISVTPAASGVSANDTLFDATVTLFGATSTPATAVNGTNTVTTTHGATVVMNADGTFTYDPPPGYIGSDTFYYNLGGSGGNSVGQVTITITNCIWFFNASNAAAGDGRLSNPFKSPASFVNNNSGNNGKVNQTLYFASGTYNSTALTLLSGQIVMGQGSTVDIPTMSGITPAPFSIALPTTTGLVGNRPTLNVGVGSTNTITVSSSGTNTLRGLTLGNVSSSGAAISSNPFFSFGFGTLVVADISISAGAQGIALAHGTLSGNFDSVTSGANGSGYNIFLDTVSTVGTVNFGSGSLSGGVQPISINGGSGSFTYSGSLSVQTIVSTSTSVTISNKTGGTVVLSGSMTGQFSSGAPISITGCTGTNSITLSGPIKTLTNAGSVSPITISGNSSGTTVDISSATSMALTPASTVAGVTMSNSGSTVTITGPSNTVTTTNSSAVSISSTTIGAAGMIFKSVTSGPSSFTGFGDGISLSNTGSLGGFHVTGTGTTAGSGGTIQHADGSDGQTSGGNCVYLSNTYDVQLNNMNIHDCQNYGIYGTTVNGMTLNHSTISGTNGTSATGNGESAVAFDNLSGTGSFTNNTIGGGWVDNFRIRNTTGTLNLTATGNTISGLTGSASAFYNMHLDASSTANINAHVQNNTFSLANRGHVFSNVANSAVMTMVFTGNTATGGGSGNCQNFAFQGGGTGSIETMNFNISNNTIAGAVCAPIFLQELGGAGTWQGEIASNTIGTAGVAGSATTSDGIHINNISASGTFTAIIDSNSVNGVGGYGIAVQTTDGSNTTNTPKTNLTVTNNSETAGVQNGFLVNAGGNAAAADQLCLDIRSNTLFSSGSGAMYLGEFTGATISLPGYLGAPSDTAAVDAFESGQNSGVTVNSAAGTNGFTGGAACAQPTVPN